MVRLWQSPHERDSNEPYNVDGRSHVTLLLLSTWSTTLPSGWFQPPLRNYSSPHRAVFMLSNQQLTPISSRCRVGSNCERDTSHAASREAVLVVSSGTLLA